MSEFAEIACAKQSRSREKINDSAKCRIIPVELKKEERGDDEWEGRNKEGERERAKYTWISSGLPRRETNSVLQIRVHLRILLW